MDLIDLADKLSQFDEYWSPRIIGEVNDSYVKLAKLNGEFVWHSHEQEDELFFVVKGRLTIRFRDRDVHLEEGQMVIVEKGVEHQPVAESEAHVLIVEPKSTLNTGDVVNERTVADLERI
ncbi:MAG: cupin domain-containing protein [Chloroflexi bacterium]|nr:cupin domain-containing protein [Chloroflexota bacterium]MYK34778.1 cupin domain-containing protein [Chloroflexota bacterium]